MNQQQYGKGGPPHPLLAAQFPQYGGKGGGKGGKGRGGGRGRGFGGRGKGKGGGGGKGGRRRGKGGGGGGRGRGRGGGARRDDEGPPRFNYDAVVGDPWAPLAPRAAAPPPAVSEAAARDPSEIVLDADDSDDDVGGDPAEIALDAGDSSSEDDGASAAKRARLLDES